jgi:hypothetical protein
MTPKRHTDPILNGSICPYCGKPTEFVDSACIYGRSYGMIYLCRPCHAFVGVHKGTDIALGRLADSNLRHWKKRAHSAFDLLWKTGQMTRHEAYRWLAEGLEKAVKDAHIGMFDENECKTVVNMSNRLLNDFRRLDVDFGAKPQTEYFPVDD